MENNLTCPKFAKCPIYQQNVFKNEKSGETYRVLYCTAGVEKYSTCKRYLVAEKVGRPAPDSIMPNSSLTIDQIIAKM